MYNMTNNNRSKQIKKKKLKKTEAKIDLKLIEACVFNLHYVRKIYRFYSSDRNIEVSYKTSTIS